MKKRMTFGSHDLVPQIHREAVEKYNQQCVEIMCRLGDSMKRLSEAGLRGRQVRQMAEFACHAAIRELKKTGEQAAPSVVARVPFQAKREGLSPNMKGILEFLETDPKS